jgi:Peptidase A4 family
MLGKELPVKRLLATVGIAILGAALVLLVAPGTHHVTHANSKRPDAAAVARARAVFEKYMSSHPTATVLPGAEGLSQGQPLAAKAADGTVTPVQTVNWSGFADVTSSSSQKFTSVSGRWTMPAMSCLPGAYRTGDVFLSQWVGLDGATDSTVEQLGSAAECYEGVEYYFVWYEMFPSATVVEGTTACIDDNVDCPQPGDQISASVTVTPGASGENDYALSLTDQTRPQENFSVTASCATTTCLDASAEWVIERPAFEVSSGPQFVTLGDYSRAVFNAGDEISGGHTASIGGFQGGPVYDVQMVDDSGGYYLDCVGQTGSPGQQLLTTDAAACPTASPSSDGAFVTTWDAPF